METVLLEIKRVEEEKQAAISSMNDCTGKLMTLRRKLQEIIMSDPEIIDYIREERNYDIFLSAVRVKYGLDTNIGRHHYTSMYVKAFPEVKEELDGEKIKLKALQKELFSVREDMERLEWKVERQKDFVIEMESYTGEV